ncbi:hypothetical protein R3W88_031451 [Solanum pinnatisectum]|uniref:RNase H type-1 domain-containing protein n=1 Tax=Solanum pinnatisectum TaxID=50273 RepID=A0AAV9LLC9_9SOLN|nr:hypothetical protein R3W88_031451 [Solanum pinnatisectum]
MLKNGNFLYDDLITECMSLMERLDITGLEHVFREQNKVVDKLAKEGAKAVDVGQPIFFEASPPCVRKELDADAIGKTYNRVEKLPLWHYPGSGCDPNY